MATANVGGTHGFRWIFRSNLSLFLLCSSPFRRGVKLLCQSHSLNSILAHRVATGRQRPSRSAQWANALAQRGLGLSRQVGFTTGARWMVVTTRPSATESRILRAMTALHPPSPAGCTNGIPSWTTCSNLATDYSNFMQAKVNRYGTKMIYELWNEPETVGCNVTQFVAAINAAHDVIRTTCPTCRILLLRSGLR